MRVRVTVYLRPRTVMILLARKDKQRGGLKWFAGVIGVSQPHMSHMISGRQPVPSGRQALVMNAFRGMGLRRGHKVCWDDVFQQTVVEDGSVTTL